MEEVSMEDGKRSEWLLECLIHVIGRAAIKIDDVCQIVGQKKQIRAFNLCDGTLTLSEIAKKSGINKANLSRTFDRWVKNGIAFRFKEGKETRLLHVFPIPLNSKVRK
jgi:Fic family protein